MSKSIEQKVRDIFAAASGLETPANDQAFGLMTGWDSLRHAEFIIALQNEFKCRFAPSEIAKLGDLNSVYRLIARESGR